MLTLTHTVAAAAPPVAADPGAVAKPADGPPMINPFHCVERFAPLPARHVRFNIFKTTDLEPCIDELEIFTAGSEPRNVALASGGARVSASGSMRSHPFHRLDHINDGVYGNEHSWIADQSTNVWVEIELPRTEIIDRIVWSRDRPERYWDRIPIEYRIDVAAEPGAWTVAVRSEGRPPGLFLGSAVVGATPPREPEPAVERVRPPVSPRHNEDAFAPVQARHVRFTILATTDVEPCIDELEILSPAPESLNVALATTGARAMASGSTEATGLIDGRYGSAFGWLGNAVTGSWVQIELPEPRTVDRVIWSRDRTGQDFTRTPVDYRIEVALETDQWMEVASSEARNKTEGLELAPENTAETPVEFFVDSWDRNNGFPQSPVHEIAQSPDGYLWIGTERGLVRFDGARFKVFHARDSKVIPAAGVAGIHVDGTGRLWLTFRSYFKDLRDNLVIYERGRFIRPDLDGCWAGGMHEGRDGRLWAITDRGAMPWNGDGFDPEGTLPEFTIDSIAKMRSNPGLDLWIAWNERIGPTLHPVFPPHHDGDDAPQSRYAPVPSQIVPCRDGSGWIIEGGVIDGKEHGPVRWRRWFPDGSLTDPQPFPWPDAPAEFHSALSDRSNNLWIGAAGQGVYRMSADGTGYDHVADPAGWKNEEIRRLFEDADGNIWAGTQRGALKRISKVPFQALGVGMGMQSDNVYSVAPCRSGGVWFGTNGGRAYRWNDSRLFYLPHSESFTWSVMEDRTGTLWEGTYGFGLHRRQHGHRTRFPVHSDHTFALLEDRQGRIWSGGDYGLTCHEHGTLTSHVPPSFDKSRFDWVISLAEDSTGAIWLGTKLGSLHRFQNGRFHTVLHPDPDDQFPVCALYFDPADALWLARFGFGLSRWEHGTFTHFTPDEGLPTATINGILDDRHGFLWMTSKQGVHRISQNDLARFIRGSHDDVIWEHFTEKDGLPSTVCHGEQNQPSLCQTPDGRIWIPTLKGIGVIDPSTLDQRRPPPPVVIEEVTAYGEGNRVIPLLEQGQFTNGSDAASMTVTVPPGQNHVHIHYTGIDFTEPRQLRFRYRLLGLNSDWRDGQGGRSATYAFLRPGDYRFELMAVNHRGIASATAGLDLTVQPLWWQTTVFRLFIGAMFLATGPAIYFARVKQLKRRHRLQARFSQDLIEREESERTRIAREVHDGLGQDLLLAKTRVLLELKRRETSGADREAWETLSGHLTDTIEHTRRICHELQPVELGRLGLQRAIGALLNRVGASGDLRVCQDVDTPDSALSNTAEIYVYRMIQEALNNVLKHAHASTVFVEVKPEAGRLRIQIEDDGVGFEQGSTPFPPGRGLGLRGMEERTRIIGGEFQILSTPGAGTSIRIHIPLPPA